MTRLKRFFIFCSGAEPLILDDSRCLMDRTKYAAIGATVLSTAVLASLSGGYAMYQTFQSWPKAVALGLLWGTIIFNLDRYIVSSLQRQRIDAGVSQKERRKIRAKEFYLALPRFALAILISFVITRPIELRLFDREINAYVEDQKSKKRLEMENQIQREFPQIAELTTANENLRQEIKNKETVCDGLHELAMSEAAGKLESRTSGHRGKGPLFAERWENYQNCRNDLEVLRNEVDLKQAANQTEITATEARRDASIALAVAKVNSMDGLLMHLEGHSHLTSQNLSLTIASALIVALFVMLETAPIIVKLLSKRGAYEDICEAREYEVYKNEKRKMSDVDDNTNTRTTLKRRRNAALLEVEERLRKSLIASMESIAAEELRKARREIATSLVQHWKHAELKNFEARFDVVSSNGHKNTITTTEVEERFHH
jgi:hypothetical protein